MGFGHLVEFGSAGLGEVHPRVRKALAEESSKPLAIIFMKSGKWDGYQRTGKSQCIASFEER